MDIILFGMQGSGKGTQGAFLIEKYGLNNFEMGAQLREMIASGSELGNKIKSTVESGNLVDDVTIMQVVEEFLSGLSVDQPVLFDGIPRTKAQADQLIELLEGHGRDAFGVFIKVTKEEAVKRMLGRGRQDDSEEIITRRLENYEAQTVPVIKEFYERDHLIEIDGEQPIEKVTSEMLEKVDYLFS